MKKSLYNNYITIKDCHTLLYNSLSHNFVIFKNALITPNDLYKFEIENSKLFIELCNAGIIIEDDFDEIEKLKDKIAEAENNDTEFILHINPTLDCNFNCWYCYQYFGYFLRIC